MSNLQDAIYDLTDATQKELCQNELDALKEGVNEYFMYHEAFIVQLSCILGLDYTEISDDDTLEKVKELKRIVDTLDFDPVRQRWESK